jgi:hypothetical protein
MSAPQQAGAAGERDRVARHARAGPESLLSSITQQPSPEAEVPLPAGRLDAAADKPAPGDPNKLTIAAQPDHTFVTGPDGGHSHVDH